MYSESLFDERWAYFTARWKAVSSGKGGVKVFKGLRNSQRLGTYTKMLPKRDLEHGALSYIWS